MTIQLGSHLMVSGPISLNPPIEYFDFISISKIPEEKNSRGKPEHQNSCCNGQQIVAVIV